MGYDGRSNDTNSKTQKCSKKSKKVVSKYSGGHAFFGRPKILDCSPFRTLSILSLSNCSIDDFSIIVENGVSLCWLDLHSNPIELTPTFDQLKKLSKLKILNLHNTSIYRAESIVALAGCGHLLGLTLYGTPISDRHGYRHHIVNTIWTLKALDHYVLSDEEIIEDAKFMYPPFRPYSTKLKINLCPSKIETEFQLREKLGEIEQIIAHYSPVIILQRTIKGYLTRRALTRAGIPCRPVNLRRTGRNLLSPKWRFPKGTIELNLSKLSNSIPKGETINAEDEFVGPADLGDVPDLSVDSLEDGLHGRKKRIELADPLTDIFNCTQQDYERVCQVRYMRLGAKAAERERLQNCARRVKRHQICDSNKEENLKKNDFLKQLSRSLDAARAVDKAYQYRERQIKFSKLVTNGEVARGDEQLALDMVQKHKKNYRVKALKNREGEEEIPRILKEREDKCLKNAAASVKEKVTVTSSNKKDHNRNVQNQRKFAEYYIKLEKELIRYNVQVNRLTRSNRQKRIIEEMRSDLKSGFEQMKNNQKMKREIIIEKNRNDQAELEIRAKRAMKKKERRTQSSRNTVTSRMEKNLQSLPHVTPTIDVNT